MNQTNGYIYIRRHESYDVFNACKLGKTNNIPERDSQYATGEIKRGNFDIVFRVSIKQMGINERLIQNKFKHLNIKYDGGIEFYNITIIELIEPLLISLDINYKKLSKEEISNLVRCNRVKNTIQKIKYKLVKHMKGNNLPLYTPRNYQKDIIQKSVEHFTYNSKGLLIIPCGVGKTLTSLWIAQELNATTILVGVPKQLLLMQWKKVSCSLFKNIPLLIVSCGITIENIILFLENNKNKCIVITTYSSAHKIYEAIKNTDFIFNVKINDECHHLTTINMKESHTTKKYIQMLNIPSTKQLSLTATTKQIESEHSNVVSNDNVDHFGEIIEEKCLLWAINENIICDYEIRTIITNEEKLEEQFSRLNITNENDKRLLLSAISILKSISSGQSQHSFMYTNNKENSQILIKFINILVNEKYFNIPNLYCSVYHSDMTTKNRKQILSDFEKSEFGIIACVYCLGEGFDFPLLDTVVFVENMSSDIRIVQSALRPCRKYNKNPNKKANIILPILNSESNWIENNQNQDLKKVKQVLYHLGLEDKTINQKIKVCELNINKRDKKDTNEEKKEEIVFNNYDDVLTTKLKLFTINRESIGVSYQKAKKILLENHIKNKEEYFKLCEKDNRLTKEPEILYKKQFKNWVDFLSIENKYYDLNTCIKRVKELSYNINYSLDSLIICKELCNLDNKFPPYDLWIEYYNVKNINEIITVKNTKKNSVII